MVVFAFFFLLSKYLVLQPAIWLQGWGKTIMLGVDKPGSLLNFSSYDILHHGKTVMGSLFGGTKPKSDIPTLLKWYTDKVIYNSLAFFQCEFFYIPPFLLMLENLWPAETWAG